MNVLRIYFPSQWRDSNSSCPWALCDASGAILEHGQSPLADIPKAKTCIGIVAADRVLIFTTPQPPGKKRHWHAALPFVAEEHTLMDPDEIHAVPAASTEDGKINVTVMEKSLLKQIIAATSSAGLPLHKLVTETLLPGVQPHSWTMVWDGCSGFLRTSTSTGQALDNGSEETPPLALTLSLQAAVPAPRKIELRFVAGAENPVAPSWNLPVALVNGTAWDWQSAPIADDIPNLLYGDFSPPLRVFDWLPKLRPVLLILLAALLIEIAGTHIEWAMLAYEKKSLSQQMEKVFRGAFGENSTLVNPPLQMQRNLVTLRHAAGVVDDADFLPLIDAAARGLGDLNSRSIQGISYESGKLEFNLKLANGDAFQSVEQKLKMNGLQVRTSDKHDLGDGTQAKLTLTREGL